MPDPSAVMEAVEWLRDKRAYWRSLAETNDGALSPQMRIEKRHALRMLALDAHYAQACGDAAGGCGFIYSYFNRPGCEDVAAKVHADLVVYRAVAEQLNNGR